MSRPSPFGTEVYRTFNTHLWKWKADGRIKSLLVNPFPHFSSGHVSHLLGYKDAADMADNWKDTDLETLKRLCGPHGFTLYKVLLVQRGMMPEEEDK